MRSAEAMRSVDEIFLERYLAHLKTAVAGAAGAHAGSVVQRIVALAGAERDTARILRDEEEWAWIHAHIVARWLGDAATTWVVAGAPGDLSVALRAALSAAREVVAAEEQGRALTRAVLATGAQMQGAFAAAPGAHAA